MLFDLCVYLYACISYNKPIIFSKYECYDLFCTFLTLFLYGNLSQKERLEKEAEIRRVREELLQQQASQKDSLS